MFGFLEYKKFNYFRNEDLAIADIFESNAKV